MISREELLAVEISPLNERLWMSCYDYPMSVSVIRRYVYMLLTFQYYDLLNKRYQWEIIISIPKIDITEILCDDLLDVEFEYYYDMTNMNYELMLQIINRFGWKIARAELEVDWDEEYTKLKNSAITLDTYLLGKELSAEERCMLLQCEDIFNDADGMLDTVEVFMLMHEGFGRYLDFRNAHEAEIRAKFNAEDRRLMEIKDWIQHPLAIQHALRCGAENGRFWAAFLCGCDGEIEFDIRDLTPEWVIGSFVMQELVSHAEQIFKYR